MTKISERDALERLLKATVNLIKPKKPEEKGTEKGGK